jgi:hypothetical protein
MLEQLISLTNSEDFFSNWHLTMEHLQYFPETETLKFVVQTVKDYDDDIDATRQFWEIECINVAAKRIYQRVFVPYLHINVLDEHPLLWNCEATRYLTLNGQPENVSQLMGDLFLKHVEVCGNWLDFNHLFRAVYNLLPEQGEVLIEMPERLIDKYGVVFKAHGIIMTEKAEEGRPGESDFKILFFGNNDTSPADYNFYQPYVVAKQFSAQLVAPNTAFVK